MARFRSRSRRSYGGMGFKAKKALTSARRRASNMGKKASTFKTIAMAAGAFLVYDKFIKK